jgi:high-affinity iron transporter
MLSILFIVARELLEAVLIVSIMGAFLRKQDLEAKGRPFLYAGVVGGIALSGLLALALYNLSEWLDGDGLLYFEAGLFFISALLMTQMVFWMRKIGARLKGHIESDLKEHLDKSGFLGVTAVAVLGIGREGSEVATYIYSLSLSDQFSVSAVVWACVLGVALALLVYRSLTRGMSRLNLGTFFAVTSVFLFLTAGSLLIEATARLTELEVLPTLVPVIWNTSTIIPTQSFLGQALSLLVGYRPMPSLMMVLVYLGYWALILGFYYGFPRFKTRAIAS